MDASERALLAGTVRDALAGAAGKGASETDTALADVGWLDMLDAEPNDALDIVFRALGAANAAASALDDVVVRALGIEPRADLAVALPLFAGWDAPGECTGTRVRARGLASAR